MELMGWGTCLLVSYPSLLLRVGPVRLPGTVPIKIARPTGGIGKGIYSYYPYHPLAYDLWQKLSLRGTRHWLGDLSPLQRLCITQAWQLADRLQYGW